MFNSVLARMLHNKRVMASFAARAYTFAESTAKVRLTRRDGRLDGLDIARGFAIALMFLSHTVKGLLSFNMMPDYGIMPIHTITKFSSSLFILVFGVSVAVVYLPKVGTSSWPKMRARLWKRGLLLLLSYKALIVVQMFERSKPQAIIDTLLWKRFPDFVEILHFYGWFVLLLPFILPMWHRLPLLGRAALVAGFSGAAIFLRGNWDFFGSWQLQAVLVEHPRAFCFGVLSRGGMALGGVLLGELIVRSRSLRQGAENLALVAVPAGLCMWLAFLFLYGDNLTGTLTRLAQNWGKHPPNLPFVLFTFGGALVLLGLFILARGNVARLLAPLALIGRESLFAFNFHIVFIWVGYRYLLGLRHNVTYHQALGLTLAVFALGCVGAWLNSQRKRATKRRPSARAVPQVAGAVGRSSLSPAEQAVVAAMVARERASGDWRGTGEVSLAERAPN